MNLNLLSSTCACRESFIGDSAGCTIAFGPEPDPQHCFLSELMEATTQQEALAVLGAAALSGFGPVALVDLIDYARVVPSEILDRLRQEFVTAPDPFGRL